MCVKVIVMSRAMPLVPPSKELICRITSDAWQKARTRAPPALTQIPLALRTLRIHLIHLMHRTLVVLLHPIALFHPMLEILLPQMEVASPLRHE